MAQLGPYVTTSTTSTTGTAVLLSSSSCVVGLGISRLVATASLAVTAAVLQQLLQAPHELLLLGQLLAVLRCLLSLQVVDVGKALQQLRAESVAGLQQDKTGQGGEYAVESLCVGVYVWTGGCVVVVVGEGVDLWKYKKDPIVEPGAPCLWPHLTGSLRQMTCWLQHPPSLDILTHLELNKGPVKREGGLPHKAEMPQLSQQWPVAGW